MCSIPFGVESLILCTLKPKLVTLNHNICYILSTKLRCVTCQVAKGTFPATQCNEYCYEDMLGNSEPTCAFLVDEIPYGDYNDQYFNIISKTLS